MPELNLAMILDTITAVVNAGYLMPLEILKRKRGLLLFNLLSVFNFVNYK